ncbi:hypothetical protein [Sulfobacillus sp. hq2]|uniref:hypothetical protein n=1 Tax=Sulfobacillus sp. hq2 TaxID=2039167 RepID=UPI000CD2867D|nr:hypothetical protein [Sulfobacillus sp. hq2]POB10397.1 hypothetical protein CO251_10660 [Sulfobacillus sp. hq2]
METWHEIAWKTWEKEQLEAQPSLIQEAVKFLDEERRAVWIERLGRPSSACARTMVRYIHSGAMPWLVTPGLSWDIAEVPSAVFMAYPAPLGNDPLAMLGLGLLWAQNRPERLQDVVDKVGVAAIWAAWEGQMSVLVGASLWRSFVARFGEDRTDAPVQKFFASVTHADVPVPQIAWGDFPNYQAYYDQLCYGVVPHDPGGASPHDIAAVLLALHFVPTPVRSMASHLATKALEGHLLSRAWHRAVTGPQEGEQTQW